MIIVGLEKVILTEEIYLGSQWRRQHGFDGFGRTHQFFERGSRTHQFLDGG